MNQTYRRLILELGQARSDDAMLRLAADFARAMGLDVHAVFVEDEALLHVAALPFAREIRLPSHQWQPMDTARMEAELRIAADAAHRRLQRAVAELGIHAAFEVRRGVPHLCIAGVCTEADIIVMRASDDAGSDGAALLRAAEDSAASVLLVPYQLVRRTGAVVAIAGAADDAALPLAARIAAATHDRLLIVRIPDGAAPPLDLAEQAAALGMPVGRLAVCNTTRADTDDVLHSLEDARERLIVVTRAAMRHLGMDDASRIARLRSVPVLVL